MHPRCLPCDEAGLPCEETSLPCDEASLPCEAAILPHVSACAIDADLLDAPSTPLVFNDSIDTTNMINVVLIDSTLADKQIFYDSVNVNTFPIIYDYNSKTDDLFTLFRQKFPASSIQRISLAFHDPITAVVKITCLIIRCTNHHRCLCCKQCIVAFPIRILQGITCQKINMRYMEFLDATHQKRHII